MLFCVGVCIAQRSAGLLSLRRRQSLRVGQRLRVVGPSRPSPEATGRRASRFVVPTSRILPFLCSALKIATSTATVGAIVGEWIGSQTGIGALIIQATYNFDSALLYSTVLCGSFFSVAFFQVVRLIERLVVRWDVGAVG